jgi:hypothetical protein
LQELQRNAALAGELDEVRTLERAFAEQDAVIGEDADRKSADISWAASADSSRNGVCASSSSAIRSRAGNFPRPMCLAVASSLPPRLTCSSLLRSSST